MTEEKTYNGWANYETWNVALWLGNEEGTESDMADMAKNERGDAYDLSGKIRGYVEGMMPDLGASMFSDLLNSAIQSVDWMEIAEAYLETYKADGSPISKAIEIKGIDYEANARLIAAAPDLLEALIKIRSAELNRGPIGTDAQRTSMLSIINQAISKAEGRED